MVGIPCERGDLAGKGAIATLTTPVHSLGKPALYSTGKRAGLIKLSVFAKGYR
ncbi:hypothetical protein [Coleofasciculus sp. G2-EDA-02]|uniref:hypothetical protein n=1 Tax=Coleofasciculus sp. G2-EDA-02 TaxID=3069529 RepID=UPI003304EF3F